MNPLAPASRVVGALVLVLVTAATAVMGAPRPASADPLGITLVHLRSSSVELSVVCPTDPPTTVLVLAGATGPRLVGQQPLDCVGGGAPQTVVVPLTESFAVGSSVDLAVTVSGDSGEINAWFPGSVVESGGAVVRAPGQPRHVRVQVWARKVAVRWHHPGLDPAAPVAGFRVWLRGDRVDLPATTHYLLLRGLQPSRTYVVRVAAHNAAGRSALVSVAFRTRHG